MKALFTLVGAGTAIVLGIIGISVWYKSLLNVLAALLPAMLVVGSVLSIIVSISGIRGNPKKVAIR